MNKPVTKSIAIVLLATVLILLVPLLAMQFTDEMNWDLADFALAGALLIGTGLVYVMAAKMVSKPGYRTIIGVVLAVALFLVWLELAVGIIENRA